MSDRLIVSLDVAYANGQAYGVAVGFRDWLDNTPLFIECVADSIASDYVSGEFWTREVPVLRKLIDRMKPHEGRRIFLVDGYVWLDANGKRGIGAVLWEDILHRNDTVIGIAKTSYRDAPHIEVLRCDSKKPLFVTAAGVDPHVAAQAIRNMHGEHRLPTLIKWTDTCTKDLVVGRSDSLRF
ncbi:MAG: endonuclease V [Candidatus Uhrbacteria bacterium]|nr:endonuclease V [Candidatus Uhrbacteria bacterium]